MHSIALRSIPFVLLGAVTFLWVFMLATPAKKQSQVTVKGGFPEIDTSLYCRASVADLSRQTILHDELDFRIAFQMCMQDEWYYEKLTRWQLPSLKVADQQLCKAHGIERGSYRELRECLLERGGVPLHK